MRRTRGYDRSLRQYQVRITRVESSFWAIAAPSQGLRPKADAGLPPAAVRGMRAQSESISMHSAPNSSPEAGNVEQQSPTKSARASAPSISAPVPSRRALTILSFIAVSVFWGTSAPALRYATAYMTPLWMVVLRFAIAGGFLWFCLSVAGQRPKLASIARVWPSALALSASNVLVTFGFQRVQAGTGALLLATTAVSFAVVDLLWPGGRTKPSWYVWIGLLLGLVGVAVLVLGKGQDTNTHWSGYLYLVGSCWTWAIGSVAQARHPSGLDPLQSSAWQMLVAAACVLPAPLLLGQPFPTTAEPRGWLAVGFLVVTASLIAFVAFVYMIRHVPPYLVGSYTYVNALVAAITGWLWLGERLDLRFLIAAVLVTSGVVMIQLKERGQVTEPSDSPVPESSRGL